MSAWNSVVVEQVVLWLCDPLTSWETNKSKKPTNWWGQAKRYGAYEIPCPLNFDLRSRSRSQAPFWHCWTSTVKLLNFAHVPNLGQYCTLNFRSRSNAMEVSWPLNVDLISRCRGHTPFWHICIPLPWTTSEWVSEYLLYGTSTAKGQ